jgi:hypothetical protein
MGCCLVEVSRSANASALRREGTSTECSLKRAELPGELDKHGVIYFS